MNVKGFIIEDDQGREFVMMYNQATLQLGKTFALRGWQRKRLVPLQYTEQELREVVGGVRVIFKDLARSLSRFSHNLHMRGIPISNSNIPATHYQGRHRH